MYRLSAGEWLRYGGTGILFSAVCAYTFYRSVKAFFLFLPFGAILYPLTLRNGLCRKRRFRLTISFRDAIGVLSSFLSAGYSVENAFYAAAEELSELYGQEEIMAREFREIAEQLRMNEPLERLLSDFALRSAVEDVQNFAEIFLIARKSGGELCGIIAHTVEVIRQKTSVLEEIETLTASRRFEQRIMNLMPFGIIFYIDLSSAGFFDLMYQTVLGRAVMTICLLGYGAAYFLSEKILDIRI